MAIIPVADLETAVRNILGESPDDDGLTLLGNLHDTLADLQGNEGGTNWRQRYEENDANWRKRYADRFNEPIDNPDDKNKDNPNNKPMTFDDLFKEVK